MHNKGDHKSGVEEVVTGIVFDGLVTENQKHYEIRIESEKYKVLKVQDPHNLFHNVNVEFADNLLITKLKINWWFL